MARRLEHSVVEELAQGMPEEELLRAAFRAEAPNLGQHIEDGRRRLADALETDASGRG
ncbi:MAG TPA: hypothetical protein VNH82_09955 [Candidatus Dormibacteraeota bacterium]|nr:hypothetical protein [Candidatus Dormibacteraeota bacterium]